MSIIEQALNQLERKERLGPMARANVPQPSRRSSGLLLVISVFVVLFFGGGAVLLWWLQAIEGAVVMPQQMVQPAPSPQTPTASAVADAQVGIAASDLPPGETTVVVEPQTSAAGKEGRDLVEVRFVASQAPLAEDELNDAKQRAPQITGPMLITERSTAAPQERVASTSRLMASRSELAPGWIADGLSQLRDGNVPTAIQTWETGLEQLASERLVLVLGAYYSNTYALLNVNQYGDRYPIFMVRGVVNERPGYYLLALPTESEYDAVREQLAREFAAPHLLGNHVERVVTRMVAARGLLATSAAEPAAARQAETTASTATIHQRDSQPQGSDVRLASKDESPAVSRVGRVQPVPQSSSATAQPAQRATPDAEQRATLGRAIQLVQAADYLAGRELLQGVLAAGFDGWEAWFWLGTAYLGNGELVEADHALSEALRRDPAQPQLWIQRAIIAQERGEHARALGWLREARNLSPQAPEVHLNIGYSAEAMGLREEAAKAYRDFLRFTEGRESFASQRTWVTRRLGIL